MRLSHIVFLIIFLIAVTQSCKNGKKSSKMNIIDTENMDLTVDPGEDFYQYANGGWMMHNPLPMEYSKYGIFDKLREDNITLIKTIMDELMTTKHKKGTIEQKVTAFFASAMDTTNIEQMGNTPLINQLNEINSIVSNGEIIGLLAQMHKMGIRPVFITYAAPDKKNSTMNITSLYQDGLGLPDVDYYTTDDTRSKEIRIKYTQHIIKMFLLSGYSPDDANNAANTIMEFETRLAKASMTRLERRDPEKTYNKMSLDELQKLSPAIDWENYFPKIGITEPGDINVSQPYFIKEVSVMLTDIPLDNWKNYLSWNIINHGAPYLSNDFVMTNFRFYGKYLSGKEEIKPRWRRVLEKSNRALGEAVGQLYVEKYFPHESKERMLTLVENLRIAFGERLSDLEWMGDTTKAKAFEKLEAFKVKIGYPDEWRDFSTVDIERDSYYANVLRTNEFNFDYTISKIGKPVDPDEWYMPPQVVNAYYNPTQNEIVFPAGILQPPFFYALGDDAVNYGAIGVVIGHEMTHGFDDMGRKYDKDGNLNNWWTDADFKRFNERSQVLVDQFNAYIVVDTMHANGKLTLGENIADLGGLNISYQAFMKVLDEKDKYKPFEGFTPQQRFFLAYAHLWAQNITDKEAMRRTKEDVHSVGRLRVNGPLVNVPDFYFAFNIDSTMPLYLAEEKRAIIW